MTSGPVTSPDVRTARQRVRGSREGRLAALLLLPSLVVVFGVVLYPLVRTIITSLYEVDSPFPGHFPYVGLAHYRSVLGSGEFWAAIERTFYFTGVSTFLELGLGILLGVLLNQRFKGRWLLRTIIVLPWALPTIVNGAMWRWIYNSQFGALNALLSQLHIISDYRSWLGSPWLALNMVIVADVWKTTPLVAFLVLAGLQTIPEDVYEAARVDGARALARFFTITLPMLVPTILVILVLRTIEAFKVFDIIFVLTRGGPANGTQTIAYYTYTTAFSDQLFGLGSSLALLVALFILSLAALYVRLLRRGEDVY